MSHGGMAVLINRKTKCLLGHTSIVDRTSFS